jgi:mannosyltransferase
VRAPGEGLATLLIVLLGTALRFHALDRQSLWDDEMSTLQTISLSGAGLRHRFATYETHPPLYFAQLRVWQRFFGGSLTALRANSAFWGSLSLPLMYAAGLALAGSSGGLWAVALLAVSPYHLLYSQELRPYALAVSLGLIAFIFLEWARRRPKSWEPWIGLTAAWTALLYTHYWGAFVIVGQGLYAAWSTPAVRARLALCAMLVAAIFAPWCFVLREQLGVIGPLNFWVPAASPFELLKSFGALGGIYFRAASSTFALPVGAGILAGSAYLWALSSVGRNAAPAVAWLAAGLGIPWILSFWKRSIFVWYRYPVLMLPAFLLLVAAGLLGLRPAWRRWAGGALLAAGAVGSAVYFHWQKANPKAVAAYVASLAPPQMTVVRPAYFSALYRYYDRRENAVDEDQLAAPERRRALHRPFIFLKMDAANDPVGDALLREFRIRSRRRFEGHSNLGLTVFELE